MLHILVIMIETMKKLPLFALLVTSVSLGITGCKTSAPKQSQDTIQTDSGTVEEQGFLVDSIGFHERRDSTLECKISVDYPRGNDSLSVCVKNFIAQKLAALYIPTNMTDEEDVIRKYPVYKGDVSNGKLVVDYYGKETMKYLLDCSKEMADFNEDVKDLPPLFQEIKINKGEDKPGYLTYRVSDEKYMGGAHGSYGFYCVNINKKTYKTVDNMVDSTRIRALQPLLRKGAVEYFKDCGEETVTDATLNDYLFLPGDNLIPLPSHTPWLQNDSLHFVYQQYEIAPYAAGLVSFNIAYKDIKQFLTKEAKALLGKF